MPVSALDLSAPAVGDSIVPHQGTTGGATSLIITRTRTIRASEIADWLKRIKGNGSPEKDPFYNAANSQTDAYLVAQRVYRKGDNKTDALLSQVFAQVPASFDTFEDIDWLFPAFTGVNVAGLDGIPASRTQPVYETVSARVSHDFFYTTNPRTITRPTEFRPVNTSNDRTNYLTTTTVPSSDEYEYYVASRQELVVRVRIREWMGDIYERLTYRVEAR